MKRLSKVLLFFILLALFTMPAMAAENGNAANPGAIGFAFAGLARTGLLKAILVCLLGAAAALAGAGIAAHCALADKRDEQPKDGTQNTETPFLSECRIELVREKLVIRPELHENQELPFHLENFTGTPEISAVCRHADCPFLMRIGKNQYGINIIVAEISHEYVPKDQSVERFDCAITAENKNEYASAEFIVEICVEAEASAATVSVPNEEGDLQSTAENSGEIKSTEALTHV